MSHDYQEISSVEDPNENTSALLDTSPAEPPQQQQEQPPANHDDDYSQPSIYGTISRVQKYANITAHLLAVSTLLVVYGWISTLGGLSWHAGQAKQVFLWHPLLMVTAFCFMTISSLSYRAPWKALDRNKNKLVHGSGWLLAAMCGTMALIAVFKSHNDGKSGYIANMYSLHSWIGATVIVLFMTQFLFGVRAFGGPHLASQRWSRPAKALLLGFHAKAGPLIYCLTGTTILLGIQDKEGFVGCAYHVDSPDYFPLQHLAKIPTPCLLSHLLGLLVFLTMVSTGIAVADFRTAR